MNEVRSSILDSYQSLAFNALYTWGIFEGAELSILNELCSNATVVKRKKGEFLFHYSSKNANDFLYILKSGTCSVIFPPTNDDVKGDKGVPGDSGDGGDCDGGGNGKDRAPVGDEVLEMEEGKVMASVVDVLAWLIRSDVPRKISIRCSSDCELVAIPSPRGKSGSYQSRLHLASFARIARMLLIRFNRTTNTTALFYLGLAEHMIPRVPAIPVPPRLQEICSLASSTGKLALSSLDASLYPESLQLIKEMIGSLLGIDSNDVSLPMERSTDEERDHQDSAESNDADYRNDDSSDLSFIPPPVAYTRTKSLDSIVENEAFLSGSPGSFFLPASPPARHRTNSFGRQTRTGLRFMQEGQTLLDIDETPGLYIIISGKVEVLFSGHSPHVRRCPTSSAKSTPSFLSRHRFISPTVFSDGDCLGQIALLAGNSTEWYGQQKQGSVRHPVLKVKALANTWLLKVSMHTYEKALAEHPAVIFHFSDRMLSVLPPMIRLFDFCTKWVNLKGGDDVVKQGEDSQGKLYIVLFGTLLCLVNETPGGDVSDEDSDEDKANTVRKDDEASSGYSQISGGERDGYIFGRGTLIGMYCFVEACFCLSLLNMIYCCLTFLNTPLSFTGDTQLLTGAPYKHTVRAIRQSALSEIPEALLEYLAHHYPSILTHVARNVSHKQQIEHKYSNTSSSSNVTSKSIMLTPVTGSVPMDLVSSTLKTCLGHCANKVQLITRYDMAYREILLRILSQYNSFYHFNVLYLQCSADAAAVFGGVLDGLSEYELILTVGEL